MSAPAPANRRSASASRRFNPLKALQPKRRLQQMLASSSSSSAPIPVPTAASGTIPIPTAASGTILVPTAASGGMQAAATENSTDSSMAVLPAFDYCRFIELDYVPMETGCMVSMRPTKGYTSSKSPTKSYASSKSPTKGYASTKSPERHISRTTTNSPSTPSRSRRSAAAAPSSRDPVGNTSLSSSSNSGSCKGSECSPTKGHHQKYTSCTDNHGIRPPPPEQYLTPLQQKEVCIRHLRARLKDTVDRLQDRDTEIGELRGQLTRMQEDWVEEECHRVEAQLALKEARREIQQLKNAVDSVRSSLMSEGAGPGPGGGADEGVQKYFHDINAQNHKLENLLLSMELHAQTGLAARDGLGEAGSVPPPGGCRLRVGGSAPASVSGESPGAATPRPAFGGRAGSCSCDCSPAHSLTRSSTYTKLSDQALADIVPPPGGGRLSAGDSGNTQDSGFVCCGEGSGGVPSRADLLLEAAFLSEETANLLSCCAQTLPLSYGQTLPPHSLPSSLSHGYAQTLPPHSLPSSLSHGGYSHTLPHAGRPSHSHHTLPHSSTYEKLGTTAPFHCSLQGGGGGVAGSASHPCLSHHHLYLHHLRETGIQTESCPAPASDLDTIAEQRTFRSQACSPTSTWLSDEGEEEGELDSITTTTTGSITTATVMTTATEPIIPVSKTPRQASALPRSATMSGSMEAPRRGEDEEEEMEEKQESEEREKDAEWLRGMSDAGSAAEGLSEISENMEDVYSEMQADREQGQVGMDQVDPVGGIEEDSEDGEKETAPGELQGETTAGGQGELESSDRTAEEEEEEEEERKAETKPENLSEEGGGGGGGRHRRASARTETAESKPSSPGSSSPDGEQPHTSQPRRSTSHDDIVKVRDEDDRDDTNEEAVVVIRGGGGGGVASEGGGGGDSASSGPVERSYWSRHFLVDLLAVAVPVVPTVAWLCRGPVRTGQPMYHIGSLLRGCCTVALCSLRRGGGLRHYPAGGGDLGGTNI